MNIVDKQLEVFNRQDLAIFFACCADDIQVFLLESNTMIANGIKQLEDSMKEAFRSSKTLNTISISRIHQNNLIIDQEKIQDILKEKF